MGLRLALSGLVLHLLLIQPNHPAAVSWGALTVFPLELPVILCVLFAVGPGYWLTVVRVTLVALLAFIATLKTADFAMFTALGRGFNPVADIALVEAGLRLATGALGPLLAIGAVIAALLTLAAVTFLTWWATGIWARLSPGRWPAAAAAGAACILAAVAIAEIGEAMGRWKLPVSPPGTAFTARVGVERVVMARETIADLRAFARAAATDPYDERADLLKALDRDMLVIFVESYGRASFDTPMHARTHLATLREAQARLSDLGLSMRSGFVTAPTRGGQSWLSHATFSNGLWIADQTSYGAALASGRKTLFHVARRSGFHTAAVMPQITLDWPEAEVMGFETILASRDLGYNGPAFNWVTMPDQFTFSALDRLLRDEQGEKPLFAQIALGSSHAPWVPVPDLVDWDSVGDGEIYEDMAARGDPPSVVWRDRDRVRDQYRKAIDYALRVVFDYAALHADDPPLMIVVGDHQPAEFVALDSRFDVPIHVIGPRHLVDRTTTWGWPEGLVPDPDGDVRGMDEMRALILDAFSAGSRERTGS